MPHATTKWLAALLASSSLLLPADPDAGAHAASLVQTADAPAAMERLVRVGNRRLRVRLAITTTMRGDVPGSDVPMGTTAATVTIQPADGKPLPRQIPTPRLFLRERSKFKSIPLRMIPTMSMHPQDGPAYSTAQFTTAVPAGTFLSAIVHVNAGKSWAKVDYRAIQVGSMLTFE